MEKKRKIRFYAATSRNWSEIYTQTPEQNNEDGPMGYDKGDDGEQASQTESNVQADQLLLKLLSNLDDRGKIILMYQILRETGYNLTHEECARTLNMSRVWYSSETKEVKQKCQKIIQSEGK